jgi:tetraacyldisaccharide 4'-kinase
MHRHLESYFLDIITGKKKGFLASLLRFFLWLLSWPFQLIVTCRNWVFDHGWVRRYYPPVPVVISIGNIVVGGTGKTPATLLLAQEFYKDFFIAVLSRGYRSPAEKFSVPVILSKGNGPIQSAAFCGDEPFLLAQNLPKAYVIVGKDKHKASDIAAGAGAQVILLDDGMQHRRLARDFEVVVLDTCDPFGQGYFLPRGLLREGTKSLDRADLLILNHVPDQETFVKMKRELERHTKALVVGTRMEVTKIESFNGEAAPLLKDKKVGIFCGIAHPEYFYKTVSQQGAHIVDSAFTADHMSLKPATLSAFAEACKMKGAELLLCTEKDKVKFVDIMRLALPVAWVKTHLSIVEGQKEWNDFIVRVKVDLKQRV